MKRPLTTLSFGLLVLVWLGVGCASGTPKIKPIALNLDIRPDGVEIEKATVRVYVWGESLQSTSLREMDPKDVEKYLERYRERTSIEGVRQGLLGTKGWNISSRDPEWTGWLKNDRADSLLIVADIPAVLSPKVGGIVIPLDKKAWRGLGSQPVILRISKDEIRLTPKPYSTR